MRATSQDTSERIAFWHSPETLETPNPKVTLQRGNP